MFVRPFRFVVEHSDGSLEQVSLVNPDNFDDWLTPPCQSENETLYFSDYNHGTIQRIVLDPDKDLRSLKIQAIANEVIIGVIGVSLRR